MAQGDPGKEQFTDIVVRVNNPHISVGMAPLMLMREELVTSNVFADRGGIDTPNQTHFIELLINADRIRRRITHNPDSKDLGDKIQRAINAEKDLEDADNPFGGDDIAMPSSLAHVLPWDFTGEDPNIPLDSALQLPSQNAIILCGALDRTIVAWPRLNSADRGLFITQSDSFRVYGAYQQIFAILETFGGDKNRVDVVQLRASKEPRGPENAPNRKDQEPGVNVGATS